MTRVLGIDLACRGWRDVGSALLELDGDSVVTVRAPALDWPTVELTPCALADTIDAFARREGVSAVGLDGPQGWRDPATDPALRGVGRRCDLACATPGKVGVHPITYPRNQVRWIGFSIEVFDLLLDRPGVALADPGRAGTPPRRGYVVMEVFPTAAWRTSGLSPLPGKGKRPELGPHWRALRSAYRLPARSTPSSHDDLQAIVAALAAAPAVSRFAVARPEGEPHRMARSADGALRRVEGWIWNVAPRRA